MASTDSTAVVTMTAACELGTHRCAGVILSLTDAHLADCQCPCHSETKGGSS